MADSDRNWRAWGERDPYYAVLTDPRFRATNIDDARDAFFESGRIFIDDTVMRLEQAFGPLNRDRALDFGCGVGRLTRPLAAHFASVTGLDVAPAMLDEARRNSEGLAIDYRLADDGLAQVEGMYDFINSTLVLQHIPVARGMAILSALLARIHPGGGCAIHISVRRRQDWLAELRYRIRHHVPGGQAILNLLTGRSADTPVMQMNEYPLADVLPLFADHGFRDLLVRNSDQGDCDTVLLLGRRS